MPPPEILPIITEAPVKKSFLLRLVSWVACIAIISLGVLTVSVYFLNKTPHSFDEPKSVTIEPGTGIKAITEKFEQAGIVRSGTLLYIVIMLQYEPTDIKASRYVFDKPLSTVAVAKRLASGDFASDLVRFTHIEGERATHIAENAAAQLTNFDKEAFLTRAIPLEGKLYPETYYIPKDFSADALVDLMVKTFDEETAPLQSKMSSYGLSYEQVLVLASILEREANSPESMRIVSGILQGRMKDGMPLQADASVEYILDKPLKELTPADLKVDSPYNTYTNRGLPPTPIGNPGIEAIMAALEPTSTDYVFYITDAEGTFHYAVTYDEHLDNIDRYLR